MSQSSRDRSSSKDDKLDEKDEPEVVFEPSKAMIEAVERGGDAGDTDDSAHTPEPEAPMDRDADIAETLSRVSLELIRIKSAYGEMVARTVGENAITQMRRS
jgi:hypothetical protein